MVADLEDRTNDAEQRTQPKRSRSEMRRKGSAIRGSDRGQAATEYIILILIVSLVCSFIIRTLPVAVQGYVRPFYFVISRPYP